MIRSIMISLYGIPPHAVFIGYLRITEIQKQIKFSHVISTVVELMTKAPIF